MAPITASAIKRPTRRRVLLRFSAAAGEGTVVRLWRCFTRDERRGMTADVIVWQQQYHPKDLRVITFDRNHFPMEVIDLRSGFRRTVDYDGTVIVSTDNENGWRIVPFRRNDGRWAILVWKIEGEFGIYRGVRLL